MKFKFNKWLWIGVLSQILTAPEPAIMKYALSGMNVPYFTFLRYFIVLLLCIPGLIGMVNKKELNKKSTKYTLLSSIFLAIAILSYTYALRMIDSSYAVILCLAGPILFIPLSIKLEKEKISRKSVAGLSLAAAGAFAVVVLPIAFAQRGNLSFNPLATLLIMLNLIGWNLYIVFYRKANESGVGLSAIMGVNAMVNVAIFGLLFGVTSYWQAGYVDFSLTANQAVAVIFSAAVAIFFSRKLNILVYEKLGSVTLSALGYLGSLLSIIVSIIFLHEQLSIGVAVGGVLIILVLYISEYHKSEHHKHASSMKHH